MNQKTERFEMRLDLQMLEAIDSWRQSQNDIPSRSEAIRRLVEFGLSANASQHLRFSSGERLMISMLCEIFKHLKLKGDIDPEVVMDAISGGHIWGLKQEYPGILHDYEDCPTSVTEVGKILDMWTIVESSYDALSKEEKDCVAKEAEPFGRSPSFRGFDGTYEADHLGVAAFMIGTLRRFANFKHRELNSHMPSLEGYRRMLIIFEPMRDSLIGRGLTGDEIIKLLNSQRHDSKLRMA